MVVAAAIAGVVPEPAVALPLALASHLLLDTVPHWNWHPGGSLGRTAASFGDIAVATLASFGFAALSPHPVVTLLACFLSTVPDLIQGPYYFLGFRPAWLCAFINWERQRQKWPWMSQAFGIGTQVVTLIVGLLVWSQRQ